MPPCCVLMWGRNKRSSMHLFHKDTGTVMRLCPQNPVAHHCGLRLYWRNWGFRWHLSLSVTMRLHSSTLATLQPLSLRAYAAATLFFIAPWHLSTKDCVPIPIDEQLPHPLWKHAHIVSCRTLFLELWLKDKFKTSYLLGLVKYTALPPFLLPCFPKFQLPTINHSMNLGSKFPEINHHMFWITCGTQSLD